MITAAAVTAFNRQKSALRRNLHSVEIEFAGKPGRTYRVGFGATRVEGGLHASGQGIELIRVGFLFWPIQPDFTPTASNTFTVRSAANDPALVGTAWQVGEWDSSSLEPDLKFTCRRCD